MADWLSELLPVGESDTSPAVVTPGTTVTRAELDARVEHWRHRLAAAGARAGGTVLIRIAPSVTYLAVVLAAMRLDTRLVLLHHRTSGAELDRHVASLRPAVVVDSLWREKISGFAVDREVVFRGGGPPSTDGPGLAVVQVSSGSTGRPKAVQRTASSIRAELDALGRLPGWVAPGEVLLTLNSIAHSFGLFGALLHALRVRAPVAFAASALPRDLETALARLSPTVITGVPAHFELLTTLRPGALATVRASVSGGQLITPAAHGAFTRRHHCSLGQVYGLTELGLVAADVGGTLASAVGPPVTGHRVAVSDGEVLVAVEESPYLGGGGEGRVRDGWFHTGDRGELRDGVLVISGRLDSVVAIGGLKVDLGEVETRLRSAPGASDAVVIADGRTIQAYVESTHSSVASLRRWCEQTLEPHKYPRRIVITSRLPRTVTGKLVRDPDVLGAVESRPG